MNKKILIADDTESVLEQIKEALRLHFDVLTCKSADKMFELLDNLDKASKGTPDLILLDIVLEHDMAGINSLKKLKNDPKLKHIPVMMITGYDDDTMIEHCLDNGALDVIQKRPSINAKILLKRIRNYLSMQDVR